MIESLLIVAGGLLGSGHCIGMCGGFALTLGSPRRSPGEPRCANACTLSGASPSTSWQGRSSASAVGNSAERAWASCNVQAGLSIVAGLVSDCGGRSSRRAWCRGRSRSKGDVPASTCSRRCCRRRICQSVFVGGLVNGLLPCGLVYAYLALAASAGNLFAGAAVMGLFGLGTMPALILSRD